MRHNTTVVNRFINFLRTLFQRRSLILEMAKRDISAQYKNSMLGFLWTFIHPIIMIFVMWLVFSIGFRVLPVGDVPFVIWITASLAIWNTFTEVVSNATESIIGNVHLVKKIVFPLSILAIVKLVGSFITHGIFLLILISLILFHGMPSSLYWIQALYYFCAMSVLALGLSWITSSVNIFARDTSQIVRVILQIGFWGTPIFWDLAIMPPKAQFILKLNPMFYIVQGYRDSFIYAVPFWEHWQMTLYFWAITGFIFVLGSMIFVRLRPHFADVL
ncbi:MAG: teichoic acid ABC transporter permease [Candidatus Schekmanbacteria bacterium RBG_16_38_10]|uniref:Transport permease protein n=1 Tax=Candidatus Schekmanbacteria bacterium RBG_16_38_10 TaxID=1817879 RepID=A0A1F7RWR4_9BACT|nr:MAG: teichoic acid ABC transporter permease [Candidatus Schekmanbacteria bacterium RBG_16_38_10]